MFYLLKGDDRGYHSGGFYLLDPTSGLGRLQMSSKVMMSKVRMRKAMTLRKRSRRKMEKRRRRWVRMFIYIYRR